MLIDARYHVHVMTRSSQRRHRRLQDPLSPPVIPGGESLATIALAEPEPPASILAYIIRQCDKQHPDWTSREITMLVIEKLEAEDDPFAVALEALVAYTWSIRRKAAASLRS